MPNEIDSSGKQVHIAFKNKTKEILSLNQVGKILESDFKDIDSSDKQISQEDKQFMHINESKSSIHKSSSQYEMPLPFKTNAPKKHWYISNFGVQSEPDKLRVVFVTLCVKAQIW